MDETNEWAVFANPGEVFRFLERNHACYQIDMYTMPPLNLVEELAYIASLMKKNPNSRAFRAISDLTALVVAAAAGKTYEMFSEIVVRDSMDKFDITYEKFLTSE
jgi:hypothetical protein